MQIKFLQIDDKECFFFGYPLKLTPTEHRLLLEISKNGDSSPDSLISLLSSDVSRGNIAVHISSINKKAYYISGRKLIIFEKAHYKINPYM